ncbi:MAG: hypothetical protein WCI74_16535, partial [Actinomycetes bacterium]
MRKFARSDGFRAAGGIVVASALVVGLAGAGTVTARADSGGDPLAGLTGGEGGDNPLGGLGIKIPDPRNTTNDPTLINQDPASTMGGGLNVTVGKSVLVSTDPTGKPGMTVLVTNTTVSGTGSRTVKVPVGTPKASNTDGFGALTQEGDSVVYNVSNTFPNQQQFQASNSKYEGQLPLKVEVTTTVDGKPVPADQFINQTGHAIINYSITNMTGRPTPLTYKNVKGENVTEVMDVEIPFGAAFSTTLPSGFADINAPWAQGGVSPAGTTLGGTLYMFAPLGEKTQVLTVEARVDHATLPATSVQAIPIALSQNSMGKLVFQYEPTVQSVIGLGYKYGGVAQEMLLKYQAMLLKYTSLVADINTKYVQPIVQKFNDGEAKKMLDDYMGQAKELIDGSQQLAALLPSATEVISYMNLALDKGSAIYNTQVMGKNSTVNKIIDSLVAAEAQVDKLMPTIATVLNTAADLGPAATQAAVDLSKTAINLCPKVNDYLDLYNEKYKNTLNEVTGILGQAGDWIGATALRNEVVGLTRDVQQFIENNGALVKKCMELGPSVYVWAQSLNKIVTDFAPTLKKAVTQLKAVQEGMQVGITGAQMFQQLEPVLQKILDNDKCTYNPDNGDPINGKGKGIKDCGLNQQVAFLYSKMIYATQQVTQKMAPGLKKLEPYLPMVYKYFGYAQKYAPMIGDYANQIPGLMVEYAGKLGMGADIAGKVVGGISDAQTLVAKNMA